VNPVTYAGLCLSPSARVCDNPRPSVGPDVGLGMARLRERGVQTAKPGRHSDGDGLHLVVSEMGRKKWVLRYQVAGVRKDKGLGAYPSVGLKDARDRATAARRLVARGVDPIEADRAAKKAAKPIPTFREIAKLVIEDAQSKSVNAKVRYQWERHLGPAYSGPLLDRPVHEITALDVAAVLRPVWRSKPEVARKLYPAIRRVFDRARVILRDEHGISMLENPARWDDLKAMGFETPKELTKGNHPSLPHGQMSEFIAVLGARKATAALALELLILTNVRTNAVLQAKWSEFDLDKALWNVPLVNLKDREHRKESFDVPLSPRAIEIVKEMEKARVSVYVFPGQRKGQPLSNMAFLMLLKRMNAAPTGETPDPVAKPRWHDPTAGRAITAHGFRASFKTWAEEVATFPHAAIEHAMGHKVGGKVERAYTRTTLLDMRRKLMDAWAAYCEPSGADEKVTPLRRKA
jgi:integrase